MPDNKLQQHLENILKKPLPGVIAHQKMTPQQRIIQEFKSEDFPHAKHASVLASIFEDSRKYYIILIKRTDYLGVHGGQISFPGGKKDAKDLNEMETALRETEEEIGILRSQMRMIGKLSNIYIPPSNFFVFPYLAFIKDPFILNKNKNEVEEIFFIELNQLSIPENKGIIEIKRDNLTIHAPCYIINGYKIWGATALILSELEILLEDFF